MRILSQAKRRCRTRQKAMASFPNRTCRDEADALVERARRCSNFVPTVTPARTNNRSYDVT